MAENHANQSSYARSVGRRIIYGFLAVLLCCGSVCLCPYLLMKLNYIRADFVGWKAERRVEQIYRRTREALPDRVTLVSEEKPDSGNYAWGLSAGSTRYACVRAQQTYMATTPFNDVLATYEANFEKWGWAPLPLGDETELLSIIFKHPSDEKLLVGVCSPVDAFRPRYPIQYVVFFDFDETSGCEGTRLHCIATRYCKYR